MISWAGRWTRTPSTTPLQPIKWNASFWIVFTSDDQPGWLMDSNPICHLSPAKEMKCSFLYYVQLLMISWAGQWTQTPSTTPLQPKQWNAHFCITFNMWCWPDWSINLNPVHPPSPAYKMKFSYFDYVQLLMIGHAGRRTRTPSTTALQPKNEMLIFGLCSLLMISWASWWTWTPSATPLLPKKWNADFSIMFNFWWSARFVNGLKVHLPPLSSQ